MATLYYLDTTLTTAQAYRIGHTDGYSCHPYPPVMANSSLNLAYWKGYFDGYDLYMRQVAEYEAAEYESELDSFEASYNPEC